MKYEFILPYPPTVNHYYRHTPQGTKISKTGRMFRLSVKKAVILTGSIKLFGGVKIHVDLFCPDWRKRDIDNTLKALLDALTHAGVYEDDSFITLLTVAKKRAPEGNKKGAAWVYVETTDKNYTTEKKSGAWYK